MKQSIAMQLPRMKKLSMCYIIVFIFLNMLIWTIPRKVDAAETGYLAEIPGEAAFVITPGGRLVGWGSNEHRYIGRSILFHYPFIARKTILKDATCISAGGFRCAMAVDNNGTLWGWGYNTRLLLTETQATFNRPITVMDGVKTVALGSDYAAAVKNDGTLWLWGSNSTGLQGVLYHREDFYDPHKVMDDVKSVFIISGVTFAIRSNNDLYAWGGILYPGVSGSTPLPSLIAEDIKSVSSTVYPVEEGSGFDVKYTYQYLTIYGDVCLFDPAIVYKSDTVATPDPIATDVRSLCRNGFVKNDDSLWIWDEESSGYMKKRDNIAYAASEGFFITKNGYLRFNPIVDWWPVVPRSINAVSPLLRNIASLSLVILFLAKWMCERLLRRKVNIHSSADEDRKKENC